MTENLQLFNEAIKEESPVKVKTKEEVKNVKEETVRLTNEAKFSVWVDILILIFIVLMFAVILYGYIIAK